MNEDQDLVIEESEIVEPQSTEVIEETDVDTSVDPKQFQSALAQKEHFRKKFEKAEADRKSLEARLSTQDTGPLAVEDYINISTALDGLDQREKARLAEEHKLSGKSLKQIRESEDYQLWQSAYRAKMEKENALKPSTAQAVENLPKSISQRVKETQSLAEKEALLKELGLYKENRPRADRVTIGSPRSV